MSSSASLAAAVILAAGKGTRMHSAHPKPLQRLAGRTFLERVMAAVAGLHPELMSVVLPAEDGQLAQATLNYYPSAQIVEQHGAVGPGQALQCAAAALQADLGPAGTVLITPADLPMLTEAELAPALRYHCDSGNDLTAVSVRLDHADEHRRIMRRQGPSGDRLEGYEDHSETELRAVAPGQAKPAHGAAQEVATGVYLCSVRAFRQCAAGSENPHRAGEISLGEVFQRLLETGRIGSYLAPNAWVFQDVNDRVQLSHVAQDYNRYLCEQWMLSGVTIVDPESTWIEDGVSIGQDVIIEPGCFLQGATVVGSDAQIGPYTTLIDAHIGPGAQVERSRVQESSIGAGASVGPWTYLRPGNELADQTKAGAFVEMKKTRVEHGSKVPHLSYIGDTHIGSNSNIGGGTITANYDGVHKNTTQIGSQVHVGAGNLFVAPVSVGDGVTTGAGTVIRHPVPDGAMAYSENSQHVVKDWKPEWER